MDRESGIVFLSGEPFLLRRCKDLPVAHKAGGAIVIKRGNSQYVHLRTASASNENRGTEK
jgi:hypothetical protein